MQHAPARAPGRRGPECALCRACGASCRRRRRATRKCHHARGLGYGEVDVASHYNNFRDRHRTLTSGSDILNLKNLNNWVKSVLIGKHIRSNGAVLDLACGKGGDMLKFQAGKCTLYVGIDIAIASVRDALNRYNGYDGRPGMVRGDADGRRLLQGLARRALPTGPY